MTMLRQALPSSAWAHETWIRFRLRLIKDLPSSGQGQQVKDLSGPAYLCLWMAIGWINQVKCPTPALLGRLWNGLCGVRGGLVLKTELN